MMQKLFLQQLTAMALYAKVVELKSFSATARHFGLTKSAVSKQIAQLENTLKVKLLHRTTRALSMTEAGRRFYERATQAVALADDARSAVSELAQSPHGVLRVTTSVTFGRLCVVPLLPKFLTRYPDVTVQLILLDRFVDLAEEGFDLAIRLSSSLPDRLIARKLLPIKYTVCAAPSYLRTHATPSAPRDLVHHNCLYYGYGDYGNRWVFDGADGRQSVRVRGNIIVNSSEAIRDLLLQGIGIGLLPTFAIEEALRKRRLQTLLTGWTPRGPFGAAIYAVWLPDRHLLPKMRVFVDFLAREWGTRQSAH